MNEDNLDESRIKPLILIVDDEDPIRRLLAKYLSLKDEFELLQASNGVEAKGILGEHDVDIVITDLLMPKMGGLALMKWGQENRPGSSWIILSGRGTFEDAISAVRLGAFDFISKPLANMDLLGISLRNVLRQRELDADRRRLNKDLENRNQRLANQVTQLKEACRVLCRQAEIIETDLHRAELIQRALLPTTAPDVDSFSVDAVYRPSLSVGGDLYDIAPLDDTHIVAYIADAAGHGVSAAMLAVLFKHRLPMMTHDYRPNSPAVALAAVNQAILEECSAPGLFVTAAYCLLDIRAGEMVIASAGHPPLILCHSDGTTEMVYHTGPALGLTKSAKFAQKRLPFQYGDRLLLYTDGLFEAAQTVQAMNSDDIARSLSNGGSDASGQEALHHLLDLAGERRLQAHQEDDITMLMLQAQKLPSSLDNGTPQPAPAASASLGAPTANILFGIVARSAAISIAGQANWTYCPAFRDACVSQLEAGNMLTVDMSLCLHLDSTFLGTIQELVDLADERGVSLRIQGLLPIVRRLFEELGMDRVIEHVSEAMLPLPGHMETINASDEIDRRVRYQVLQAHKTLATLSEANREEFVRLIEGLQNELDQDESTSHPQEAHAQ